MRRSESCSQVAKGLVEEIRQNPLRDARGAVGSDASVHVCVCVGLGVQAAPAASAVLFFPPFSRTPLKIHSPREESDWLSWGYAHAHWPGEGGAP